MTRYSLLTLLLALLISFTLQHTCVHDHLKQDLKISGPEYEMYEKGPGRFLLEYQNIQILVDASTLTGVSDDFENYIMNSVMPAVTNYFEATIKVPQRSKKLKAGGFSSMCSGDVKVPSIYNSVGVDADLILFVKAKNEPSASYVAAASACLLDTSTQRPIIGRMTYNIAKVTPTDNDADREKDIVTTMHELTHVLGFSSSLFPYYVDPNTGNTLKGHVITKSIMGYSTMILNTNALTTRVRNYFNCSTLPGAYLENQGGSGSAGSHFERRVFYNEYMTASSLIDSRVTEFTLALLEGTGWYQINYDMAEPMTWGKNKGCSFVEGACVNTATKKANFDEFCSPILSKGCSWTRRAGSSCGAFQLQVSSGLVSSTNWWGNNTVMTDTFADNCPIQIPYGNIDCEDPDNQDGATISGELYGYGSKCFMGTLYPKGKLASSYPFCFKSSCKVDSQGRNYIELKVGSRTVTCNSQKDISVSGYNGVLSCPDPDDFCGQIQSEGYCRRKCSGRGSCIQKNCACIEGWTGFDCSKPTYLDQCSRCQNDDPLRTSCYGDTCQCNPSNTTCMCLLGLKTGSACKAIIAANTAITTDDTSASASTSTPTTTNTTSNVTPSTTSSTSDNQAKNTPNSSSTATTNNSAVTTPNTSNPTNNVPDTSNNSTSDVPSNNIPSAPTTNSSTDTPTTDVSTTDPSSTQTNNTSSPSSDPSNTSTTTDPAPNPSSNNTTNTDSNPSPNSSESEEGEDVPVSTMTNSTTTIDSRVSVKAPADEKNGGSIVETIGSNTSNNVVLPAALGAVGGALTLAGVYLGVRYVKNFLAKRRRVQSGRTNSQAGRTINRPPKLQIPIASTKGVLHTEEHSVHSGQNSPDLSRGRESMRSHNDSPLISQHSPMKERTYPHSLFRNYITQNRMLDHDTKDFGLKIKPILPEGRAEDIENPELKSETPELTPAKIEGVSLQEIQIKKSSVRDSDE